MYKTRSLTRAVPLRRARLALCVAILAVPWVVTAQEQVPRTIAYDGYLELGGEAISGEAAMRFTLSNEGGSTLWTEEHSSEMTKSCGEPDDAEPCMITLHNGQFSVALGAYVDLEAWILDAEPLYLSIAVLDGLNTWVDLDNRQLLTPTPYSLWAMQATDMTVDGDLNVGAGGIDVYGTLDVPSLSTDGTLYAETQVTGRSSASAPTVTQTGSAGAIEVDGDITANSVNVLGDVEFYADGSYGATAIHWDSVDDQLEIGDGAAGISYTVQFNGLMHLNGNVSFESTLYARDTRLGSNIFWNDLDPFLIYFADWGTSTEHNTSISTTDYFCWIGGWHFDGTTNISNNKEAELVRAYTYRSSGTWRISMDINSSSNHDSHEAAVVCAHVSFVNRVDADWFN